MAHWTAEDVLREIVDLNQLFLVRKECDIVHKMMNQIQTKLQHACDISPSILVKLSTGLNNTSLPASMKDSLQAALDERAMSQTASTLQLVAKPQTLTHIFNYLSKQDVAQMTNAPLPTMIQIICKRMKMCGMKAMKEKTKKPILAFLNHLVVGRGEPPLTPLDIYKQGQNLSDAFTACVQEPLVPGVAVYPASPQELGDEFQLHQ